MKEQEYYHSMSTFDDYVSFEDIHKIWYDCFVYGMKKCGVNSKSAHNLFYNFHMNNWNTMHKENTEYKDYTKEKLLQAFSSECYYISDRLSFDRLFRAHWLFLQVFNDEMNRVRYPSLYEDEETNT